MMRARRIESSNRRGLVLFMVLVSIIVVTVTLVSIAQESFRVTNDAVRAKRDLQHKWGAESLRRSVLPVASVMFDETEKSRRKAGNDEPMPSEFGGTLRLGGLGFTFVLADEDARANVNSLYHYGGGEKAAAAIRELSGAFVAVRLNPEVPAIGGQKMVQEMPVPAGAAATDEEEPRVGADFASDAFRSWGQVFDLNRAPALRSGAPNLSCFGGPALNVRRASDDCIIETAAVVVAKGKARTIVENYRRSRASEIDRIIDRHTPNRWHRLQLKRLLSESSVCYSLRIVSGSPGSKPGSLVGIRDSFAAITLDEEGAMRTREVEY